MLGAIIGDIVGSRFEWHNYKAKDFELFHQKCFFTDDSVLSLAICRALLDCQEDYGDLRELAVKNLRAFAYAYPDAGYGGRFNGWLYFENTEPYYSCGNGSAMRVSGVAYAAQSLEQVKKLSLMVTDVTHNHPEGIKGAEATAVAAFLAKEGYSKKEIREYISRHYYALDFSLDDIRRDYSYDVTCQGSVPQALEAFLEADSYEDAIRNAISIGGDSDTLAAIAGGVAECFYGIPQHLREKGKSYLSEDLLNVLLEFEAKYPPKIIE